MIFASAFLLAMPTFAGACIATPRTQDDLGLPALLQKSAAQVQRPFARGVETTDPVWEHQPDVQLGATSDAIRAMRQATVIVKSADGWGSGALLEGDRIVTNYHVVESTLAATALSGQPAQFGLIFCNASGSRVTKGLEAQATLLRVDPNHDLAILKALKVPKGIKPLKLSTADPELGSLAYAIGSQGGGLAWALKLGTVSGVYDYPAELTDTVVFTGEADDVSPPTRRLHADVVVTDCTISPGDSGGPLLDDKGRLTALTFATPTNLTQGAVGYHIAARHIRALLDRPDMGVVIPDLWTAGIARDSFTVFSPWAPDGSPEGSARVMLASVIGLGDDGEMVGLAHGIFFATPRQPAPPSGLAHHAPKGVALPEATFKASRFAIWQRPAANQKALVFSGRMDAQGQPTVINVAPGHGELIKTRYSRDPKSGAWTVTRLSASEAMKLSPIAAEGLGKADAQLYRQLAEITRTHK